MMLINQHDVFEGNLSGFFRGFSQRYNRYPMDGGMDEGMIDR